MNTLLRTVLRMVLLAAGLWLVSVTAPAPTRPVTWRRST